MAVERLRVKRDVADALRGVRIAETLQNVITGDDDNSLFEIIVDWWIQSTPLIKFDVDA